MQKKNPRVYKKVPKTLKPIFIIHCLLLFDEILLLLWQGSQRDQLKNNIKIVFIFLLSE